ncbi:phosphopantetheine-binding protein [Nocardioides sp. SYSU DS0651]|uniref:phosphopantetheine-binding protein n=1 Tax=Nocardioides sp. SYSU DS0651 TaxID=3415955 RepID=UPI003F4BFC31
MSTDRARSIIADFLQRANKPFEQLTDDVGLYGGGLELDSLEAAELSAMLEDELGSDPFSSGDVLPETVGEVVGFYEVARTA